jgi:hypothetical protein
MLISYHTTTLGHNIDGHNLTFQDLQRRCMLPLSVLLTSYEPHNSTLETLFSVTSVFETEMIKCISAGPRRVCTFLNLYSRLVSLQWSSTEQYSNVTEGISTTAQSQSFLVSCSVAHNFSLQLFLQCNHMNLYHMMLDTSATQHAY